MCQPESAFDLSFAAQVINPKEEDAKRLNKRLQWQINNKARGLRFVPLNLRDLSTHSIVFKVILFVSISLLRASQAFDLVIASAGFESPSTHLISAIKRRSYDCLKHIKSTMSLFS
jgi:hypothetical protein